MVMWGVMVMKDEIKEIKIDKNAKSIFFINNGIGFSQFGIADEILDLITNLQEENNNLKEDFKRHIDRINELNERSDNLQDTLKDREEYCYGLETQLTNLQEKLEGYKQERDKFKSRNEKAIENIDLVIELIKQQPTEDDSWILNKLNGFKYLLNGGDKNEH